MAERACSGAIRIERLRRLYDPVVAADKVYERGYEREM